MLKAFFLPVTENYVATWRDHLETLPPGIQHEILRLKTPHTKIQKTYGRILLARTLTGLGYPETILNEIAISENGKPVIPSFPGDFNISHSHHLIALVVSDKPGAGIDIEKIRYVNPVGFRHFFSNEEWHRIIHSNEKESTLLRLWTVKEALLKARSTGFSQGVEHLHINYATNTANFIADDTTYYWNYIDAGSAYIACYATSEKDVIPEITVVHDLFH